MLPAAVVAAVILAGAVVPSAQAKTSVATQPVCGQPASSKPPSTKVQRQASSARSASSRRTVKRRANRRKPAAVRRELARRAHRRAAAAARKKRAASKSSEPIRATLTLDQEDQETVTAAAFGRSTDPQPLTLVYRVAGCRAAANLLPRTPLPTGPVRTAGARPLPLGSVQVDDVDADGDRYVVHLLVYASANSTARADGTAKSSPAPAGHFTVAPGSYTSFVRLKADWLRTVATPVTVTRSEDTEWIPIGIGIGGGLAGFLLFWLLRKIHGDDLLVKETWVLWLTAVVCVVTGAGTAFFTNYLNQDIWTFSANGLALFTAAFSASTAGVAAGLLTGIYKTTTTPSPPPKTGAAGAAPPASGGDTANA